MFQITYKNLGIIKRTKTVNSIPALQRKLSRIRAFGGDIEDIKRLRNLVG